MTSKRKYNNVFLEKYASEFKGIKRSKKGTDFAHCTTCDEHINLTSMGKSAITTHQSSTKHKAAVKAMSSTQSLANFISSLSAPTALDEKVTAAEGAWAYHTAIHHQSFNSTGCVSSEGLFRAMFSDSEVAKKFSSAQTKTAKIITGVLGPFSVEQLLMALSTQLFSISIDASNHKEKKLFPIVIRFFNADKGVQVRLLDLQSLPGEDAERVVRFIDAVLEKHGLNYSKMVSFCADNAPVNFGGPQHQGKKNVFHFLKEKSNNLVPIGCPAHILHNSAQKAAERLPIDIEAIVFKLGSFFKGSTLRHEKLKKFCEIVEVEYSTLPTHGPTRWTTLLTVINRMLELWDPLMTMFTTIEKPPRMLEDFFKSSSSEIICSFLQSVLTVFQQSILLLQKSKLLLPELTGMMNKFKKQIVQRKKDKFYGAKTSNLLAILDDPEQAEQLKSSFEEFYDTVLEYIDKWFRLESFPSNIMWIMLQGQEIDYEEVQLLAEQIAPEVAEMDALFDEVSQLNSIIKEIPEQAWEKTAEEKWMLIFKNNQEMPNLYELVSRILSIPVSNAFVERIFSLCAAQWTKERNLLSVETVKALLQIKTNFDYSCPEMLAYLMKDWNLRQRIRNSEKY